MFKSTAYITHPHKTTLVSAEVGRYYIPPYATILAQSFCFIHFHERFHSYSPVIGSFDEAFLIKHWMLRNSLNHKVKTCVALLSLD